MGLEGGRRKKREQKEKPSILKTLSRDAIIAAGALAAIHGANISKKTELTSALDKTTLQKSDREGALKSDKEIKSLRFRDFRRSTNIIDRRFDSDAERMLPVEEYELLKSREEQDQERNIGNSKMSVEMGITSIGKTKMPRDTHVVAHWNRKNQIDHAIKKVQRETLDPPLHKSTDKKKR